MSLQDLTPYSRSLRSVEWTIQILDTEHFNEHATKVGAIGFLSHLPESRSDYDSSPESCYASLAVEPRTFNALFDVLVAGRLPDWLSVSVKGMTYGLDPDGREKIWDTQENRVLPIVEVSIRVPVAAAATSATESEEHTHEPQLVLPATSADTRAISDRLASAMTNLQERIVRQLKYLVAIALVSLLVVLFR